MRIPPNKFERLVQQAYWDLPQSVRSALDNIDIVVNDRPGTEAERAMDADGHDHDGALLGLYVGVPLVERHSADLLLPDCIYLYRLPILSMCQDVGEVKREIRTTLLHEIGHYLGLNEDDLDRLGYA